MARWLLPPQFAAVLRTLVGGDEIGIGGVGGVTVCPDGSIALIDVYGCRVLRVRTSPAGGAGAASIDVVAGARGQDGPGPVLQALH